MMEELLIKYLDNKCSTDELTEIELLFRNDTQLKLEVEDMKRIDKIMSSKFNHVPNPTLAVNIKANLYSAYVKKRDYTDFILPGLFFLGSIIYFIINYSNFSTDDSPLDLSQYSFYINVGFFSMSGILGLYFFDQYLSNRKKSESFRMFSL